MDVVQIIREVTEVVHIEQGTGDVVIVQPLSETVVHVIERGLQGPPGPAGGEGLMAVVDDPAPALGGNLTLGVHNIIGQLENNDFILDGGLLG